MNKEKKILKQVNDLENVVSNYSKEQMQNKTNEFIKQLKQEKKIEEILPEAFAMVREAVKRNTGKRLYDVQIIGGYYLHQGRIAEIKAGEGKTLIESLPAYLNALNKKGVHIITTNEYLAKRDFEEVGRILKYLGLSVGFIYQGMETKDRKEAYKMDVTYGMNTEFGFDYLRDNSVRDIKDIVQRELNYAIIDEADSILLDEAQTPMIISQKVKEDNIEEFRKARDFVNKLNGRRIIKEEPKNKNQQRENENYDYIVDETYKTVELTEKGMKKAEIEYGVSNYYDADNYKTINFVRQALRAKELLKKDVDYIVLNNEVKLIDRYTGRIMHGKRFMKGLHQAIEAKEGLKIENNSKLIASITVQNYFKMYNKLSGMTGTAKTSEKEFNTVYSLDVVQVPENKKSKRIDRKDIIFDDEKSKYEAVVEEIKISKKKRQPVLIGTTSIENSEKLSDILKRENIEHNILNAKNNKEEALIVKEAGDVGKVTIATNMAGRGTNILLGGENEKRKEEVTKAGGLKIIGTEKHESRRIDEQLRGRSGRQGQVGESIFLLSLDDDLIRIYGNRKNINKYKKYKLRTLKNNLLNKEFFKAQSRAENRNYTIRKRMVYYDEVLDKQREIIYNDRKQVLAQNITEIVENFISYFCDNIVKISNSKDERIIKSLEQQEHIQVNQKNIGILKEKIYNRYKDKENELGRENFLTQVQSKLLMIIDDNWIEHLESMEDIKANMELRVYGGYNPIDEYKIEGSKEFDLLKYKIKMNFVCQLLFNENYI